MHEGAIIIRPIVIALKVNILVSYDTFFAGLFASALEYEFERLQSIYFILNAFRDIPRANIRIKSNKNSLIECIDNVSHVYADGIFYLNDSIFVIGF